MLILTEIQIKKKIKNCLGWDSVGVLLYSIKRVKGQKALSLLKNISFQYIISAC